MPREDGGRDWPAVAVSRGIPRIAHKTPGARERQGQVFPYRFQRNITYGQVDFRLRACRTVKE